MVKLKIIFCSILLFVLFNAKGQNTSKFYHYNIKIHPVLEGIVLGYEHVLKGTKGKSIKSNLVLRGNEGNSLFYPMHDYKEQKFDAQFRHYFSANSSNLQGFYQGANIQFKHFADTATDIFDFRFPRSNEPIKINNKSICLGYAFGYQVMSHSGFNLDIGYIVSKQFLNGEAFKTYILDEIPYRPYVNGINSQLIIGLGIAF
jgi:opacity protein-like surface antigen